MSRRSSPSRATTSTRRRGSARTARSSPGSPGTIPNAVGRHRAVGRRLSGDGSVRDAMQSPAVPENRSSSRSGRPTARSTSSPTAPAGGISIAGMKTKSKPLCPDGSGVRQPQWVFGRSLYGFASDRAHRLYATPRTAAITSPALDTATETLARHRTAVHGDFASSRRRTGASSSSAHRRPDRCAVVVAGSITREQLRSVAPSRARRPSTPATSRGAEPIEFPPRTA